MDPSEPVATPQIENPHIVDSPNREIAAYEIVRALSKCDDLVVEFPYGTEVCCIFCHVDVLATNQNIHTEDCLWRLAAEWVRDYD